MDGYWRLGVGLLVLASALLMAASAYAVFAAGHPKDITVYQPYSTPYVSPRIGPVEAVVFVVVEHALVGLGVMFLLRSVRGA